MRGIYAALPAIERSNRGAAPETRQRVAFQGFADTLDPSCLYADSLTRLYSGIAQETACSASGIGELAPRVVRVIVEAQKGSRIRNRIG